MTATPWDELRHGPWAPTEVVPAYPPPEQTRAKLDLPHSLRPVAGGGVRQRPVFDPAMSARGMGMRLSEPEFDDTELATAWFGVRRDAVDTVLAALADSPWREHLMLRGSVLLSAWFGERAREPGDVDFIVLPADWKFHSQLTETMLADIADRVATRTHTSATVRIRASDAVDDDIWTYDRVPGRRLVLPWTAIDDRIPSGTVQLDFVFNESPQQSPQWTEIPRLGRPGPAVRMLAATPELSLAWKLLWLTDDRFPEGKDLYDAVLLAEHCTPTAELLEAVSPHTWFARLPDIAGEVDWAEFAKDRPDLTDQRDAFAWRLTVALAPAFPDHLATICDDLADSAWRLAMAACDRTTNEHEGLLFEDRLEIWPHSTTVHRIIAVRANYNCSLTEAAQRITAARRRRPDCPLIAARVNPHTVAETLQQWSDPERGFTHTG